MRSQRGVSQKADVAHLSTVHPAVDTRIYYKECMTLVTAGYRVTWVCTTEDGREGPKDDDAGVVVHRLKRRRGRVSRMLLGTFEGLRVALRCGARVIHVHDSELILAALVARVLGRHVVYDIHEDTPKQILSKHWVPKVLRMPMAGAVWALEWLACRTCSRVVLAEPLSSRRLAKDAVLVQNFPKEEEFAHDVARPLCVGGSVCYVGGIMGIRGAREMIDAMALLGPEVGARLVLAGKIMESGLADELQVRKGWDRVDFVGWASRDDVRAILQASVAGLCILHPVPNYVDAWPVKIMEYMLAGIPTIASDFPVIRAMLDNGDLGLLVDPTDPSAIADAITWCIEHRGEAEAMGTRARAKALARYTWGSEARKLLAMYAELIPVG